MKYKKVLVTLLFGFVDILICFAEDLVPFDALDAPRTQEFLKNEGVDFSFDLLRSKDEVLSRGLAQRLRSDARSTLSDSNRASLVEYISLALTVEDPGVWQPSLKFLSRLQIRDFSKLSREIISQAKGDGYFEVNIPRVYGAAGMSYLKLRNNIDEVSEDLEISREGYPLVWNSLLALAKNGDPDSIEKVVGYVRALPEGSFYLGSPLIVHDLPYVSQPEVVDLLVEYLFDDTIYDGSYDVVAVPVASFAAGALSRILVGFPAERRIWNIEDIQEARGWINQYSGPWKIVDHRDELRSDSWVSKQVDQEANLIASSRDEVVEDSIKSVGKETEKGNSGPSKSDENSNSESTFGWWFLFIVGLVVFVCLVLLIFIYIRAKP
mgnify:CR=1 FL=1|tara:strand:- start:349 stop:1488 length:1140 start_codon:yes stop_codon:yes gene_type:complete